MKPPPFVYHRPASVEEAAQLLADVVGEDGERGEGGEGGEAKVIAGGQSLVPLLNFRLASPGHLVDINAIDALGGLDVRPGAVDVGATVRDARLLSERAVAVAHPLLAEATRWIAHPVIRNRGTVCGSLAHADPAAELPAVLSLLDGSIEAVAWRAGALARRRVGAGDLFAGPLQTTLEPDELVVAARFPTLGARTGWAVDELALRRGDFALAGVALTVTVDGAGAPTAGRAVYMSCAPTPVVVDIGPAIVESPGPDALYALVASALDPTDDIHASGEYRRHLAATLTVRALGRALARARARIDADREHPSEVPA